MYCTPTGATYIWLDRCYLGLTCCMFPSSTGVDSHVRHSRAAILPSSRSAYFWSINLDLKFNWNFHVEICHKGSTFKLHPIYIKSDLDRHRRKVALNIVIKPIINPLVLVSIWKFHDLWCVPCTVMDKTSNIALNSTRMQQAHYFRHILHAEKITGRPEGGDIAPCPPP